MKYKQNWTEGRLPYGPISNPSIKESLMKIDTNKQGIQCKEKGYPNQMCKCNQPGKSVTERLNSGADFASTPGDLI